MPTLVFLPWLRIEIAFQVGSYRCVPYDPEQETSPDVRRILGVYKDSAGGELEGATLVEVYGQVGGEITDEIHRQLLALREIIAFAGLRGRSYFSQTGYVNDHTFTLVAQNYVPGSPGRASTSRRRDGRARSYYADDQAILCAEHVATEPHPKLDEKLVNALWSAINVTAGAGAGALEGSDGGTSGEQQASTGDELLEAIEFFNLANTDDPAPREHTELVLVVAAIQRVLGISEKSRSKELEEAVASALDEVLPSSKAPSNVARTLPHHGRSSLRGLWFWDLYRQRGSIAHGQRDGIPNPVWSVREHLLLSAYIFPLLVLARMKRSQHYTMTDEDLNDFAGIDHVLCLPDLFGAVQRNDKKSQQSAFVVALNDARRERDRERWVRLLRERASSAPDSS